MKVIILAFALGVSWRVHGQEKPTTGFLVTSLQINETATFNFFVAAEIDTTKSLEENILKVKQDTLKRVSVGKLSLDRAFSVTNAEDNDRVITILPMEVIFGDWIMYDMFLQKDPFVKFPIKVFNQRIIAGYNAHSIRSFKKARIIQLSD